MKILTKIIAICDITAFIMIPVLVLLLIWGKEELFVCKLIATDIVILITSYVFLKVTDEDDDI